MLITLPIQPLGLLSHPNLDYQGFKIQVQYAGWLTDMGTGNPA
jgi:hypothetical protein